MSAKVVHRPLPATLLGRPTGMRGGAGGELKELKGGFAEPGTDLERAFGK